MKIKQRGRPLKIMCRKTMVQTMKGKCKANLQRIKREISQDAKFACTTADIWTHNIRRVLGVTVHWVYYFLRQFSHHTHIQINFKNFIKKCLEHSNALSIDGKLLKLGVSVRKIILAKILAKAEKDPATKQGKFWDRFR